MHPNDPRLRSFVDVAPTSDFPIQNLPYGVFSTASSPTPRVGVAIGDFVLDLACLEMAGLVDAQGTFSAGTLNLFMALGTATWSRLRAEISALLAADTPRLRDDAALRERALVPLRNVHLHMPFKVEGYTDFYSSREHATNVGLLFRDKSNPLLPNWLHIPIGYNGRASTIILSGTDVRRPLGQLKGPNDPAPSFGACRKLDYELEMGVVVGQGSALGEGLTIEAAQAAIFGFVLLNDWSARDIQQWEYVPLGPFQAKAFATSISPWVVTAEALEPFRVAGPAQEPEPLPYLRHPAGHYNYDIRLEADLRAAGGTHDTPIARTNFSYMYWSSAQQLAHHASSGCAMCAGDLLGSGTISGPGRHELGSLLELSLNGTQPFPLEGGGTRAFLEDGDTLAMRGFAQGDGYRVGFGTVAARILPARAAASA